MEIIIVLIGLCVAFICGIRVGYAVGLTAAWRAFFRGMDKEFKEK